MDTYTSQPHTVNASAEQVFARLSRPSAFNDRIEALPAEVREKLRDVHFGDDHISFNVAPVGEMKLLVSQRVSPSLIVLRPESSPIEVSIAVHIAAKGDNEADITAELQADLNFFLRQMVGDRLNDAADKLAQMLAMIPY